MKKDTAIKDTVIKICNAWKMFDNDDISNERFLEMIRQECNLQDVSDVITGLVKGGIANEESECE